MIVKDLVEKHGTNNAFQIAIQNNIKLIYEPLGKIYGYYNQVDGQKFIHISDNVPWYHREFRVGHLLFHALTKENERIVVWKNRFPNSHIWSKNETEGIKFAIKLMFETIELTNVNSYRELCYVRGCNEKEYQELRNEILKNVNVDVENISLNEFFKYMFDFNSNK